MATVNGLTAEAMIAIRDSVVVDGEIVGDDLILKTYDNTEINAGDVRGPQGIQGPAGDLSEATADTLYVKQAWTPFYIRDYGAVCDGVTDDTAAIQAAIDAAKVYSNTKNGFTSRVDFGGQMARVTGSLNCTGIRSPGFTIQNGGISSEATGKIALDFAGTNTPILLNFKVYGHATSTPSVGIYVGRGQVSGSYPACANARFVNVEVNGYFSKTAVLNFASEVNHFSACMFQNKSRLLTAYAYACIGHAQTMLDYWTTAVTSDYITLPGTGDGAQSNILHYESQLQCLRAADVNLAITGVTKANPGVVSVNSAALTASSLANGDQIVIQGIGGMTELEGRVFTVAGINLGAGTFQLSGENTSAYTTYTSGGAVHNRTGPAVLWNGVQDAVWDASYLLTYGTTAMHWDLNNGGDIRGCRINLHCEDSPPFLFRLDRAGSVKVIPDMEIKLLQSNQSHKDHIFQQQGASGSIRFDRLKFSAVQLLGTLTNGIFSPAANFGFRDADIWLPVATSFFSKTPSWLGVYSEWSGKIQCTDTPTSQIAKVTAATTTQLTNKAHAINLVDKTVGRCVFNTTTSKPVWATAGLDVSTWVDATGTLAHTPV